MIFEWFHHAAVIVGSRLYAIGGRGNDSRIPTGEGRSGNRLDMIEFLDLDYPEQGWQLHPARLEFGRSHFAAVQVNGQIWAIGGWGRRSLHLTSVEILDTNVTPSEVALIRGPTMTVGCSCHTAVVVDNTILVAAGYTRVHGQLDILLSMEMLLVTKMAPQWQVVGVNMPMPLADSTAVSSGECMVLIGGMTMNKGERDCW